MIQYNKEETRPNPYRKGALFYSLLLIYFCNVLTVACPNEPSTLILLLAGLLGLLGFDGACGFTLLYKILHLR